MIQQNGEQVDVGRTNLSKLICVWHTDEKATLGSVILHYSRVKMAEVFSIEYFMYDEIHDTSSSTKDISVSEFRALLTDSLLLRRNHFLYAAFLMHFD